MEVYGLTGGIGSGKSTVASMLEEYGIPVVSADELSRMVVAPGSQGLTDVVEAFGAEVLDERGELDRKKIGRVVFATPERRKQLEAILHPRIRERYEQVLDALEKVGHPVMVYEVPLLFEKKLDQQDEMKAVILVAATADTRIARVKARDSLTTDDVLARMRAQMPEPDKRARADYIVHNDGNVDDLRREVEYLLSRFLHAPVRTESTRPRAIEALEPELEPEPEIEPELEIDESDIDTLSPEDIVEEEAPVAETPSPTAPAAALTTASTNVAPVSVAPTPSTIVGPAPVQPAAPSPSTTAPELEVELRPATPLAANKPPKAATSGTSWIPAPAAPQPVPSPAPAGPPRTPTPPKTPAPPPTTSTPPKTPAPPPTTSTPEAGPGAQQHQGRRQRMGTMPQLSVPEITRTLSKQLSTLQDDEEPNT